MDMLRVNMKCVMRMKNVDGVAGAMPQNKNPDAESAGAGSCSVRKPLVSSSLLQRNTSRVM